MKKKIHYSKSALIAAALFLLIIIPVICIKPNYENGSYGTSLFSGKPKSKTIKPLKVSDPFNGIYFWRTTFDISNEERAFITTHNINRLYLHLFDVDIAQQHLLAEELPVPIATLVFPNSVTTAQTTSLVQDIVPVCFITLPALKMMQDKEKDYAQKIVQRMLNICSYHNLKNKVTEIQIDCDWTPSTERLYFTLLTEIKELLQKEHILLSATIRLHQLRTAAPPIDKGVLMVYNTGAIKNRKTENSILSLGDAAQYLSHSSVDKYALPLDYALPAFSWGVWFREDKFMGILHRDNYSNPHYYEATDSTHYRVLHNHMVEERELQAGDIIRLEKSAYQTIMRVKALLPFADKKHKTHKQSVILYHLDANKLEDYESQQINNLYSRSNEL